MLVGDLPPPRPHIVIVEPAQTQTKANFSDSGRVRKPPSGGEIATGMQDNEPEKERSGLSGFFVTKLAERSREEHPEAIGRVEDSFPKFRTVADAESQIKADQELLKKSNDLNLKLTLAKRIDESYRHLFELREKERQGLASV